MRNVYEGYKELLESWVLSSQRYLYKCPQRPGLICYGTGYDGWGMQTQQKGFSAYAVMAVLTKENDEGDGKAAELRETALGLLRFCLESHIEGSHTCMDGRKWGHTWISALGTERMMHGVDALWDCLTAEDKALLQKVLVSECDWLMDYYAIVAGPVKDNKPESNLWNGALLHRTALMYSDTPRAAQYREKGTAFLLNAISLPEDAQSSRIIEGKPLSQWHAGYNFFESLALNHHGYMNVGYMVICLSNTAMLHFKYKKEGIKPPPSLYHNVKPLWQLIKQCTFPDGRLLRIGGDTRVRYCYCQDYALPMWYFVYDYLKDEKALDFIRSWKELVAREAAAGGDGQFLSVRLKGLYEKSPIYYTRLESDRASAISMALYWQELCEGINNERAEDESMSGEHTTSAEEKAPCFDWHDSYHGSVFTRGAKRSASWTWLAAQKPQGLCVPLKASDMAEWRENLAGRIKGLGKTNWREIISHEERSFSGGFVTWGQMAVFSDVFLSEGKAKEQVAVEELACAALPDDRTLVVLHRARAVNRSYFSEVKGINLQIPNDLFNDTRRTLYYGGGEEALLSMSAEETRPLLSRWANADDAMGLVLIYGDDGLWLKRPGKRQIGLFYNNVQEESYALGFLSCEELLTAVKDKAFEANDGATLLDLGYAATAGEDHGQTQSLSEACRSLPCGEFLRGVLVKGGDEKQYVFFLNLSEEEQEVPVKDILPGDMKHTGLRSVETGGLLALETKKGQLRLKGKEAALWELMP